MQIADCRLQINRPHWRESSDPSPTQIVRGRVVFWMTLAALLAAACTDRPLAPAPGVSWELADQRAGMLSAVRYDVAFSIPDSVGEPIRARETIRFTRERSRQPLVLDFTAPAANVHRVAVGGETVPHEVAEGHLVVPRSALQPGENSVEIEFTAGDLSLNRNPDFLYTLFVPDRASSAFPCFDQPNLKATFRLTLETPATWRAVANGKLASTAVTGDRAIHRFAETQPISTYLFSFAAGRFQVDSAERGGRVMHMYHRETDGAKVSRNRDAIFDLHRTALDWLETYTGIPYPFDKFDFVLVPAFQYGGMEHPGAILYRASSLFLDESATQNQLLGRASLIAHETAHMWFGDLVTMNWFDDVWTKEVFANFMAAKIVNPSFPDIDHDLAFFLRHYPAAYEIDRTAGTHPIRQPLENLKDAGTLYGAIIYQKAPIVMRQLERITGDSAFRDGMRAYLSTYAYHNATWPDLVSILDDRTPEGLATWSAVWVEQPDRPTVAVEVTADDGGRIGTLVVTQHDPAARGRIWNQPVELLLGWDDSTWTAPIRLDRASVTVPRAVGLPVPQYVLPDGGGVGYAYFRLDPASAGYLLEHLPAIADAATRGAAWVTLWDALLEGAVSPERFVDLVLTALPAEDNELTTQRILDYLRSAYWRYLAAPRREALAPDVERTLWDQLERASSTSLKAAYFDAFTSVAVTDSGLHRLERIWWQEVQVPGLPLSERDYTTLAQGLAVREMPGSATILARQAARIDNPDRAAEFAFLRPAMSPDPAVRDAFFESLREPANREHEPWVIRALSLLHHPLRAGRAERYIRPSLDLLEEIQRTGDIFFPTRWLDATLSGHGSPAAAAAVRTFLDEHPAYPEQLRRKILQAADPVFRAARIVHGYESVL